MHETTFNLGDALLRDERQRFTEPQEQRERDKGLEPKIRAVGLADFLTFGFPPRENILAPWLPSQGLAMLYAPRGIGKTHISLGIAVAVASGGNFLRWSADRPRGVVFIDGEMPGVVLQERLSRIIASPDVTEPTAPLKIITPDLQTHGMPDLSTTEGQAAVEPHLAGASLVVIDNLSCLCRSGRENEAESWLPVQSWALGLRARGLSVLFVHHAGRNGLSRGTSRREDVLDTIITLKRPGDYRPEEGARFEVHFEKARGIYGDDTKPFEASLTGLDGGQTWTFKDLEESLTERVAALIGEGVPQVEIAESLGVSKAAVTRHKQKAQAQGLLR